MQRNLTRGSVPQELFHFALPLFLANLLQTFYNIADMMVVGRLIGSAAIVAVSNATRICFLINSLCNGVTMGGCVVAAHCAGAENKQALKRCVSSLLFLVTTMGMAACYSTYSALFRLIQVPEESLAQARIYFVIFTMGIPFFFGYNAVCAILRGTGDSKSPLLFISITSVINIVLDIVLVGPLRMGIAGAALATALSQGAAFGMAMVLFLKRFPQLRKNEPADSGVPEISDNTEGIGRTIWIILKTGLPLTLQMTVLNISYLIIAGLFNSYGVAEAAAAGIGLKISTMEVMPCWAVGQAVTTMAGQNAGAGETERVRKTARAGVLFSLIITGFIMILIQVFPRLIMKGFTSSPDVIEKGVIYLRICCSANVLLYAVMYTLDSFATGLGDSVFAMANSLWHSVGMRLLLSWFFSLQLGLGFTGLCLGEGLSPIISCIAGCVYFYSGRWKKKKLI